MVVNVYKSKHPLLILGYELLYCCYFRYQNGIDELARIYLLLVVLNLILGIKSIQVFANKRGAVVAGQHSVYIYHRHNFESDDLFE